MIDFKADPFGFTLGFKGRTVLRHGMKIACMAVGRGEGRIDTRHGMYHVRGENGVVWINAEAFKVLLTLPGSVIIEFIGLGTLEARVEDGRLVLRFIASNLEMNRFRITVETDPEECVYGCGEQFSRADLRGGRFPLWVSEPGVGRGVNYVRVLADLHSGRGGSITHTYFPQPSFVTSGNLYCHVVASSFAVFDFQASSRAGLTFWQFPDAIILGVESSQPDAMDGFTRLIGRQPALPDWAYEGIWLGVQGGRAVVEAKLEKALAAGIHVTALWCQDWQGIRMTPYCKQLYWNWEYDANLYPDLPGFIEYLHARGIRFLGYNNPFLAADTPQYAEASMKGFLVKSVDGNDYRTSTTTFPVSMLDLSNPAARDWIKGIIKKHMLGIGLDGWMADFGEYLPTEGVLASGADPFLEHNRYPVEWARINREAVEEAGKEGKVLFFCRSGYSGSIGEAPLFWAGDQLVDFLPDAGLPSVIAAGISAGMSGVGNWHFDIGGFLSVAWIKRSRDVLMRSVELAAFTQIMRTHEGINPVVNVQFDSDDGMLAQFARMTRVHTALKPYQLALSAEYTSTGIPPIRPISMYYEADVKIRKRPVSFLYGRDLLVAPVLRSANRFMSKSDVQVSTVLLPEDDWVHLWTGQRYGSGRIRIRAPYGEPPVFWRRNSEFAQLFRDIPAIAVSGAGSSLSSEVQHGDE